jgi:hypothetical protein
MRTTLALVLIGLAAGCAASSKQIATDESEKKGTVSCPYQRFLPADFPAAGTNYRGLFALDTQTGQLCRTTEYSFEEPIKGLNRVPTCLSLTLPTSGFKEWQEKQKKSQSGFQKF